MHLTTYAAIILSFFHQVWTGASFVSDPVAKLWWVGLYALVFAAVIWYRLLVPFWRSVYHRLRVVAVYPEGAGTVSIVLQGRHLDRLRVNGGQFMQWRFLRPGLWWQAHPYSLSAMPMPPYLRVTVKDLGDHSGELARITPGTRVAIEGPYGAFTRHAAERDKLLLVGAGVGVTPIRAMLEDLPADADVDVILRATTEQELVLDEEVAELVERRGGRLHRLVGDRRQVSLTPELVRALVPDLHERELYICGPGASPIASSPSPATSACDATTSTTRSSRSDATLDHDRRRHGAGRCRRDRAAASEHTPAGGGCGQLCGDGVRERHGLDSRRRADPRAQPQAARRPRSRPTSERPGPSPARLATDQYGQLKVKLTVKNGRITRVGFTTFVANDGHSVQIDQSAAPMLIRETIAAQSAHIQGVSGATYTSNAYEQSLQAAVDKAGLKS